MRIRTYLLGSMLAFGALASNGVLAAETTEGAKAPASAESAASDASWKVWGGRAGFRWNTSLLNDLGIELRVHEQLRDSKREDGRPEYALRDASALDFAVNNGHFAGFTGGTLAFRGGVEFVTAKGTVSLRDMRLVPRPDDRFVLDVVGNDGTAWLFVDRMMYVVEGGKTPVLSIKTMDLRIAPALAKLLGDAKLDGLSVADMAMTTRIHSDNGDPAVFRAKGGSNKWHRTPVPGQPGQTYQADVFMHDFDVRYKRRRTVGGTPVVVFAPSSTLRNNRNNGSAQPTFPSFTPRATGGALPASDPLGTSTALHAADVPWYTKFSGNSPPHGNDQHPFLIWNLFRIDADGRIEQIARSGVKHAWLTTNFPCDEDGGSSHILYRGCADTYSDGNNDAINDLGPRSEIVPAAGLWGRCGSVYDGDCDGDSDSFLPAPCAGLPSGPARDECEDYSYRMEVAEADIDPAQNPGATYFFESWYIVRDDINIFNTMQSRPVTFGFSSNVWSINNGVNANLRLGPALDRWVAHDTREPDEHSADIANDGGHARIAMKVADLGDGTYRYDYAVMNFDFARAQTSGGEPDLRVLSNDGFTAFSLPVSAAVTVTDITFSDGDRNASNDWQMTRGANTISWSAPAGNRLNWGTMFRFSLVANAAPIESDVSLTTARVAPEVLTATSLLPQSDAVETYAVGGELSGLAAGQSVALTLNDGPVLELETNDVFGFTNEVIEGGAYEVAVETQPATQTCTVTNGEGQINGADVTDVAVDCVDNLYHVGGSVSGLGAGQEISLQLNGDESITVGNGAFAFDAGLTAGTDYSVAVTAHPADRVCSVQNGDASIVDGDVTDVVVSCIGLEMHSIGGIVSGLVPSVDVELQLNGGEILVKSGNGTFQFTTQLPEGVQYSVAVVGQPQGRECVVSNDSGTVGENNVNNVQVLCSVPQTYAIGGSISGLAPGSGVVLQLNDMAPFTRTINGAFSFPSELPDASEYTVTVVSQPGNRACSVGNGSGTVMSADVRNVTVTCVRLPDAMFDDGFE